MSLTPRATMRRSRTGALLVAALVVTVAGGLTLPRLECPGLYYDEVLFVDGWSATRCAWCPWGVPLMELSYLGALKAWIYWPVRSDLSPLLLRAPWVVASLISALLTVLTAGRAFGRTASVVAAALVATDPAFLYFQRLDWGPVAIGVLLRALVLFLLVRWRTRRSERTLVVVAFLLGLGVYDKLSFAWFVAGLVIAVGLDREYRQAIALRRLPGLVLAFTLGALPLLVYNVVLPLASLRQNQLLADAGPLRAALGYRLRVIVEALDGSAVYGHVNARPLGDASPCPDGLAWLHPILCEALPLGGSLLPYVFLACLVAAVALPRLRRDPYVRLVAWPSLTTLAALLLIANVGPHHVPTLFPALHLLAAGAAGALAAQGRALRRVALLALVVVVGANTIVSARTITSFATRCGKERFSETIYSLVTFARSHPEEPIFVADWGFACQLRALAPDARVVDVSWSLQKDPEAAWRALTSSPGGGYVVLHDPALTVMPRARERLLQLARDAGYELTTVDTLRDREHDPVVVIVKLASRSPDRAAASAPPSSSPGASGDPR